MRCTEETRGTLRLCLTSKSWKCGRRHTPCHCVHRVTARIRGSQYSSLRNQLFKSAMSIAANIVEGRSQKSEREFARFLGYALHSSTELEHHLIVARDIEVMAENDFVSLISQT